MNKFPPIMYLDPKTNQPKELYLSDSQVKTFQTAPWDWFDDKVLRLPRKPQMQVMAVGSSFDSKVKHMLSSALYGPQHEMTLAMAGQFESSVEPHNRDQAHLDGEDCLKRYIQCGRYDQLLARLSKASTVQFESDLRRPHPAGYVKASHQDDCYTVPVDVYDIDEEASLIKGQMQIVPGTGKRMHVKVIVKPDVAAIYDDTGIPVSEITDWKVNGYYSKKGATIQPQCFEAEDGRIIQCKRGYLYGPEGMNPEHTLSWPIPKEWSCQLHLYSHVMQVHLGLIPEETGLNEVPLFPTHVAIDQLAWFPEPARHMDVYQYHSEANDDRYTKLHAKFSMVVTAIVNGWWDPWCGSRQQILEKAKGRLNSASNTKMAGLCRTR